MRQTPLALLTAVLLFGCSTPFPPPASVPQATAPALPSLKNRLSTFPRVVPAAGQPGYRVCADCSAPEPTPKTVAARADIHPVATTQPVKPVTVRYAASIPFAFGSSTLDAQGSDALDAFVARLPPGLAPRLLSVAGRTDNVGLRAANARIARARAKTVLASLRTRLHPRNEDIAAEPLCCYIASNATAAGRADNRRVDVVAVLDIE